MRILGVDPGTSGALALLDARGALLRVEDAPHFEVSRGRGKKKEIDVLGLADLIVAMKPDATFFEQTHGMAGDGESAAYNFGRAAGCVEAIAKVQGARFTFVPPPVWKRAMGLIRTAKDDSRAKATAMWPDFAQSFRRKCDDGRAEAALIAEYGRRKMLELGML